MSDLQQAIAAIQAGDRKNAQRLLAEILQTDPQNENAWLWLSQIVESEERRQECLQRVLAINPNNRAAQAGLAKLKQAVPEVPEAVASAQVQKQQSPLVKVSSQPKAKLKPLSKAIPETVHYQDNKVLLADKKIVLNGETYETAHIVSVVMEVKRVSEKTYRNIMIISLLIITCPNLVNLLNFWLGLRSVGFRITMWFIRVYAQ
jgi:tetratricopeptide (TPR) repeat protein